MNIEIYLEKRRAQGTQSGYLAVNDSPIRNDHIERARGKSEQRERERATGVDRKTVDGFSNQPTDRKINYLF